MGWGVHDYPEPDLKWEREHYTDEWEEYEMYEDDDEYEHDNYDDESFP